MRLDGNKGPHCYVPFNPKFQEYGIHSDLFYSYSSELRVRDFLRIADIKPELTLVVKCLIAMGLFDDCAEILIWRFFLGEHISDAETHWRETMPRIADAIDRKQHPEMIYRELYFLFVLPIVAAVDMEHTKLAQSMYMKCAVQLEREWL